MNYKKIAILLATYNGEKYLTNQIDSIINQSNKNWMLYIHDDNSTDKTPEILESYVKRYPDQIILVPGKSTGGARNNFLYLFQQVEAEFYMCCDQDDIWLPNKIELTWNAMRSIEHHNNKPCLVFTDLKVVDQKLNTTAESMNLYQKLNCEDVSLEHILVQNIVTGCTMMVNRSLRDRLIQFHYKDDIIMHDWWAGLIAANYGTIFYLNQPTILYRQHENNSVGAKKMDYRAIFKKIHSDERKQIKVSLESTRKQAKEFAQTFFLDSTSLIYQYSKVNEKNKISRVYFYYKNHIRKSSAFRTLGLYVFG